MNTIDSGMSPISFDLLGATSINSKSGEQQIEAVGVEFESVFLSMMIKEMRNSLEGGGFFGEESSDTYGGMFDLFIGKHMAESKPLGISDLLLQQYKKSQATADAFGAAAEDANTARPATSLTA